ncbi:MULTISPECIES: tannase/feruloyl esterase family alpha/beta hydrolase [unclassified Streptomyces]|uniref:tannase/feruloyl esterase family alpha/beta hydrolase n=1 Tax=unclassified Streptomyces TaxID=2593676 RepID=UPI0038652495
MTASLFTGKNLKAYLKESGGIYDSTDPDLAAFYRSGGKLIHWHGLSDGYIPPTGSITYRQAVIDTTGRATADKFYRFYTVPGMFHCAGGYGASSRRMTRCSPRSPTTSTGCAGWRPASPACPGSKKGPSPRTANRRTSPPCPGHQGAPAPSYDNRCVALTGITRAHHGDITASSPGMDKGRPSRCGCRRCRPAETDSYRPLPVELTLPRSDTVPRRLGLGAVSDRVDGDGHLVAKGANSSTAKEGCL